MYTSANYSSLSFFWSSLQARPKSLATLLQEIQDVYYYIHTVLYYTIYLHAQYGLFAGTELVQALSKLRTSEGFWDSNNALYDIIFSRKPNVKDKGSEFSKLAGAVNHQAFATILVLAFLNKHVRRDKTIWQGIWQKAVKFLEVSCAIMTRNHRVKTFTLTLLNGRNERRRCVVSAIPYVQYVDWYQRLVSTSASNKLSTDRRTAVCLYSNTNSSCVCSFLLNMAWWRWSIPLLDGHRQTWQALIRNEQNKINKNDRFLHADQGRHRSTVCGSPCTGC